MNSEILFSVSSHVCWVCWVYIQVLKSVIIDSSRIFSNSGHWCWMIPRHYPSRKKHNANISNKQQESPHVLLQTLSFCWLFFFLLMPFKLPALISHRQASSAWLLCCHEGRFPTPAWPSRVHVPKNHWVDAVSLKKLMVLTLPTTCSRDFTTFFFTCMSLTSWGHTTGGLLILWHRGIVENRLGAGPLFLGRHGLLLACLTTSIHGLYVIHRHVDITEYNDYLTKENNNYQHSNTAC